MTTDKNGQKLIAESYAYVYKSIGFEVFVKVPTNILFPIAGRRS